MSLIFKCKGFDYRKNTVTKSEGTASTGLLGGSLTLRLESLTTEIPDDQFCELIRYFMTSTDLAKNDPRLKLLKKLKKATIGQGFNGKKTKRIQKL